MRTVPPTSTSTGAVAERLGLSPYRLSTEAVANFWERGLLGPLRCEAPQLNGLLDCLHGAEPAKCDTGKKNIYDPQQTLAAVRQLAQHPSIVHPVAQLLGCEQLSFFQGRFRVKEPGRVDPQPWHQDVGKNHGGLFADGSPIPSITLWLSLDGADAVSGGVVLIPGSHLTLLGDWKKGYRALSGLESTLDKAAAVALAMPPGQFYLFHSWAVHCSLTNYSSRPRSALILRYMGRSNALDVSFPHQHCDIVS